MPDNYPYRITFYEDHRGKKLVLDFINSLPKWEQAKVYNSLRLLAEFGALLRMPHARHIQGKLWELRPGGVRLFYFTFKNNEFVILHGFRKQSKQAPRLEMEVALRRLRELEET